MTLNGKKQFQFERLKRSIFILCLTEMEQIQKRLSRENDKKLIKISTRSIYMYECKAVILKCSVREAMVLKQF